MDDFPSRYEPTGIEAKWLRFWTEQGIFTADVKSEKKTYSIVIPPPNVTGRLTIGHILDNAIQDILIRYKKISGYETLWVAGMDHAGIATQVVVEEKLLKEGIKREDIGRERFVEEVWKWKEEYATAIREQLNKMGCALDWSQESFTLSEDYSQKVIKVFVELYNKGLIYRGEYIINWCPRCLTALSDEQAETEEEPGTLYYIRYPVVGTDDFISVATTRPETMLGDTAVCVNPKDTRYKKLIGKMALLPIMKRKIPIIADEYVDPEFGTGALKVTPAHDPFDFELAKKHKLEFINIMNPDATLNENTKEFNTLDRYEARKKVIDILKTEGLLEKTEDYRLPLAKCERCHTAIEPRISKQWFVKMKPLAAPALKVVKEEKIKIYPARWINLYNHWLENVRDWCISRQLWWGHRIPVYYCRKCFDPENADSRKGIVVSATKPEKCPDCNSPSVYQDDDVLDTWFSSWLWPFATLGWPNDTIYYQRFYPTQTLVTGWDIIYLWVARMIMAGLEFTGKIPFRNVVFHPMIRDEKGRKFSKSLGNSPEPMNLIDTFGADALRFGLLLITPKEQDVLFSEKSIEVGRNFCNKLWNASRLVWINHKDDSETLPRQLSIYDTWILDEFSRFLKSIEDHYMRFELNAIAREMYDFVWHVFCDWYLEFTKIIQDKSIAKYLLKQIIIILHPFIPFITEEIYQRFNYAEKSIVLEGWPSTVETKEDTTGVTTIKNLIADIRNIRGLLSINAKEKLNVIINTNERLGRFFQQNLDVMRKLAGLDRVDFNKPLTVPAASVILPGVECFILVSGIEVTREKDRLRTEIEFLTKRIDEIKNRLKNPQYVNRASDEIKEREKTRLEDFLKKKDSLEKVIEKL